MSNYVALYESGAIDVGVIVTRAGEDVRELARRVIGEVKAVGIGNNPGWALRMAKLADDPLGTSTTANMGKLIPRLDRGDGRGCPILAIAITSRCFEPPEHLMADEVHRLANVAAAVQPSVDETVEEASGNGEA